MSDKTDDEANFAASVQLAEMQWEKFGALDDDNAAVLYARDTIANLKRQLAVWQQLDQVGCWRLEPCAAQVADTGDYSCWWEVQEHRVGEKHPVRIAEGTTPFEALSAALEAGNE